MVENFFPDEISLDEGITQNDIIEITTLSGISEQFIIDKEPEVDTIEPLIDDPLYIRDTITLAE